ncbi:uncharacterized protein N7484_010369 [Penicillium longicatenatum]|uniref:uncharacterized protein n=1 Tax=Penicillium longicatenatum TaxID=1561947 RepID=UPI002548C6EC|nr:uncharacterized protein N7484_010369 [Penicillium longicatenatum]KAJ5630269.1 hypothetical protein N7484_010369 [Penicillium longicatenatum]
MSAFLLQVATSGTTASHSDAIIIADDERLPIPEPGTSRPQKAPRRDYSYPDFKSMDFSDDGADTEPSRKRKRTETGESSTLTRAPHEALGCSFGEEQAQKDTKGAITAKKTGLQDLLYAARPLGGFAMWAHGLQVVRRKSCDSKEMPSL